MKTDLFIPKTIVVGYQERSDTFTGQLGYVIYKDNKGVLRKEKSWQGWRDKSIEPREFDNTPTNGFTFNKGVQRYGDWHSSGRSMVRVWDPRGYEFEVSIENLIGLLMHSDVSKRDIVQDCVFAWHGTELILLPTNSEVYQESVKYTEKQDMKIGAKELGIGYTYELKKERAHVVYLGRFPTYDMVRDRTERWGNSISNQQVDKKPQHVFINLETKTIEFKSPTQYIAQVVSEECHPQYADLLDKFYEKYESQPMVGVKTVSDNLVDVRSPNFMEQYNSSAAYSTSLGYYACGQALSNVKGKNWIQLDETHFIEVHVEIDLTPIDYHTRKMQPPKLSVTYSRVGVYDPEDRRIRFSNQGRSGYYSSDEPERILPDFNENTPGVAEKIRQVHQDFTNAIQGWVPFDRDNYPLTEDILKTLENIIGVAKAYNFGYLYPIMKDGRVAQTQIY